MFRWFFILFVLDDCVFFFIDVCLSLSSRVIATLLEVARRIGHGLNVHWCLEMNAPAF